MKPPPVTVVCRECHGSGRVGLAPAYAEVLDRIGMSWITTPTIESKLKDVKRQALCNRLAWLEKAGLIKSQRSRFGKGQREWKRL